ncbi:hypothetical protein S40285_10404 [Stachybotrys chlorohalonatus IBT 40285]|jgi:hypothetical protein|uniref:Uncharacterized protein n=1 Tax=Stachybotrys chlorohalonatus (strain IBT 40285) TaxID=1283841 RepID=A0A084QA04_STAC4|nr:hypothetical protein S40285_10404 [Stachybotrys chlorohalonata IBT 40285]
MESNNILEAFNRDMETAARFNIPQGEMDRFHRVACCGGVTRWLAYRTAHICVLHDPQSMPPCGSLSLMSKYCSKLWKLYKDIGLSPLAYFCGPPGRDPLDMMRSLTVQLLQVVTRSDLSPPDEPSRFIQSIMDGGLVTVMAMFTRLSQTLPRSKKVTILIDSAYRSDHGQSALDMRTVMQFLDEIVRRRSATNRGGFFKVLATNPSAWEQRQWGLEFIQVNISYI